MSQSAWGGLLGLACALGILLIAAWLAARRPPNVAARIGPFVSSGSRERDYEAAWRALLALVLPQRFHNATPRLRSRLSRSGSAESPGQFRVEQLAWSAVGGLAGALTGGVIGAPSPAGVIVLAAIGAVAGALAREWRLSQRIRQRSQRLDDELPASAELLAFALAAGESPRGAIVRLAESTDGVLAEEFGRVVAESRSGVPLESSLRSMAGRTASESLSRFVEALLLATERGTPLAEVMREQASDVRSEARRRLLTLAGRKDVAMLAPVVFLILPTVVVVALFPGLSSLHLIAA